MSIVDQRSITLSVRFSFGAGLKVTAAASVVNLIRNTTYPSTLSVNVVGGSGTYTYAISPALPTGLAFNTTTGSYSGKPTVVSALTTYTVTVTDTITSEVATASFQLSVT